MKILLLIPVAKKAEAEAELSKIMGAEILLTAYRYLEGEELAVFIHDVPDDRLKASINSFTSLGSISFPDKNESESVSLSKRGLSKDKPEKAKPVESEVANVELKPVAKK